MPKTRGAYAFRDFDATRILSRPYFKILSLPKGDDDEIIKSLRATDNDSIYTMEEKLKLTQAIKKSVEELLQLNIRHIDRLARYSARKGQNVVFDYVTTTYFCRNLVKRISELYSEIDAVLKSRYRKVFIERLRTARRKTGLTQELFAARVGLTKSAYGLYESGQRDIATATLIKITKELKCDANWLLGITP